MTCEQCGQFFEPGQNSDMIQGGCPGCGQPYAHQPTPLHSEMEMRNMPAPGESDMGGNPLKEGILADGGWQNRQKRDESFASVKRSNDFRSDDYDYGTQNPDVGIGGKGSQPWGMPCEHCGGEAVKDLNTGFVNCRDCGQVYDPDEPTTGTFSSWNDALKPKLAWEDAGDWPEQEGTPVEPGLEQQIKQIGQPLGEGQMCTGCGGRGCHRCMGTGSEPIPMAHQLSEDPQGPLMDKVRQVGPYQGNTSNQIPYLSYLAGEDPQFEIEEVETPDPKSVKDKELKDAIKEFEKSANVFGGAWNAVKGAGQLAWNHPLEVGGAALGAGLIATGVGAPLGAGLEAGALGAGAAEAGAGAAGLAEGAGAAGAMGEAAGGLSAAQKAQNAASWMGSAMKKGVGTAAKIEGGHALLNQGAGMVTGEPVGGAPGGMAPAPSPDARTIQQITHMKTADDFETPTSHGEIPQNRDGDSNVKSDGDNHEWQKDYSQADGGAAAHGTEALSVAFSPDTDSAYEALFPLIHHFYNSEEDGSHHPLMQALHQMMETDMPGYLQHADGHESQPHDPLSNDPTIANHEEDHTDSTDSDIKQSNAPMPMAPPAGGGVPSLTQPIPQPPGAGPNTSKCLNGHNVDPSAPSCPQCGAAITRSPGADANNLVQPELQVQAALGDPTPPVSPYIDAPDIPEGVQVGDYRKMRNMKGVFETCPGCGMKNMMGDPICRGCHMSLDSQRTASDHQGPHTPEQIAAVAQLLQQQGRGEEVSNMILQPWEYADELASIQQNPDVPDGEQQGQPMPPVEQTPPNAGMPVPGMSAPGPGAGPPAPMMMSSVTAADSVAKKCPKCGSHTTGLVSQKDGTSSCHSCGNIFKSPNLLADDGNSSDFSTTAALRLALDHARPNFEGVPAADQKHQEDPDREQDTTLAWKDESGAPLRVGQQYKMKSSAYNIPDIIRIEAVRPESIEYSIVGEYGIAGNTKVDFLEAQQDGLTFEPFGSDPSQEQSFDIEQNDDDQTQREQGGMETSDLSSPHQTLSSTAVGEYGEYETNPALDWLREGEDFMRTAGARFTPMEQREFIEESGEARNRDKLDLQGTHYESSIEEDQFLFGL